MWGWRFGAEKVPAAKDPDDVARLGSRHHYDWAADAAERAEKAAATRASPEGRALLAGAECVIKCGGCGHAGTDREFASPQGLQFTACPHCGLTIQIDWICGQAVVTVVKAGAP